MCSELCIGKSLNSKVHKLSLMTMVGAPKSELWAYFYAREKQNTASKNSPDQSASAWRKQVAKWIQQEREESNDSEQEDSMENRDNQPHCQHQAKWLPQSLSILFGGQAKNPVS